MSRVPTLAISQQEVAVKVAAIESTVAAMEDQLTAIGETLRKMDAKLDTALDDAALARGEVERMSDDFKLWRRAGYGVGVAVVWIIAWAVDHWALLRGIR